MPRTAQPTALIPNRFGLVGCRPSPGRRVPACASRAPAAPGGSARWPSEPDDHCRQPTPRSHPVAARRALRCARAHRHQRQESVSSPPTEGGASKRAMPYGTAAQRGSVAVHIAFAGPVGMWNIEGCRADNIDRPQEPPQRRQRQRCRATEPPTCLISARSRREPDHTAGTQPERCRRFRLKPRAAPLHQLLSVIVPCRGDAHVVKLPSGPRSAGTIACRTNCGTWILVPSFARMTRKARPSHSCVTSCVLGAEMRRADSRSSRRANTVSVAP